MRLSAFVAALFFLFSYTESRAEFPSATVTIVVPYSASGATDVLARNLAKVWSEHWKKPVVVVNRTGADGMIGSQYVKGLPADGHTVLMQVNQALFWPVTIPQADIDLLRDFRLVSKLQQNPMVFGVTVASPDQTFSGFIERCRQAQTPCSFGAATRHGEIMARQIIEKAQLRQAVVIPYKGTAPMMIDALGGHVSMGMPSLSVAMPHMRSQTFRALAVGSNERLSAIAQVPTLLEQGLDMTVMTWYGLMVRAGTPKAAVDAIVQAIEIASKDPQVLKTMHHEGATPLFSSPESFAREAKEEFALVKPLLDKYLLGNEPPAAAAK
jgi:tripartite-type tricarboxylate transporter receptor subunit TctC